MPIIYEPKGRAMEYSPLAANLYTGCVHGCKYCYAPAVLRKKRESFHSNDVQPRLKILERLETDCIKMTGDIRQILLCFACDPYQPIVLGDITRDALLILEKYDMNVAILTKGGMRASRDFDILERNGWSFGTSMTFSHNNFIEEWEPRAADVNSRVEAIRLAHKMGIRTWLSLEPVISVGQTLWLISFLKGDVDHWKIGKLNHMPKIERDIDWSSFLILVEKYLAGESYYIKKDLEAFRERH